MLRSVNLVRWTAKAIDYIKKPSSKVTIKRLRHSCAQCYYYYLDKSQELSKQQPRHLELTWSGARISRGMSQAKSKPKHTNRLIEAKSPYLLQHAHNPVDWYPWGPEAIKRAQRENKPIFLSVGYSTCHWCHVMERESFEDESVAALMNEHFVNIKVDREERPDIDKIYMQFVLMLNGSGGWPMSVWLTPDLTPITGGTYFPPKDRFGVPSFTSVLKLISEKWSHSDSKIKESGESVIGVIRKTLCLKTSQSELEEGSADAKLEEAIKVFESRFDLLHGGFGSSPKFPEVSRLNFLFHAYIATKNDNVLELVLRSLNKIGNGGIHDHVFGGFSRYAVDRIWHIPHFEKMLYDQGQLMAAYANAFKLTGEEYYLKCANGIFEYIRKDLCHPEGGYYAGEDADSLPTYDSTEKVEGAFYAWTWEEIKSAVENNSKLFTSISTEKAFEIYSDYYTLKPNGNVLPSSDPQGHLLEKNILIVTMKKENILSKHEISEDELDLVLKTINNILHEIRDQRPRPHLDTKIICSWNGLVLSGLAKLANCGSPNRDIYMEAAKDLVEFVKKNLINPETKELLRSCYGVDTDDTTERNLAPGTIDGFLDDYAFMIKGLLDYYKASLDGSILKLAKDLQDKQDELFWDATDGGYFYSKENSPNVVIRLKEDHDGAEPCGNSVSARNLILLSHYFDEQSYRLKATSLFNFFADNHPFGYVLPEMLSALLLHEYGLDLVAVVGPDSETTQRFVEICRKFYIPGMIIVHVDPEQSEAAYSERVQQKFKMVNGKPTVYICHDKVCRMPVTDPEKLQENLMQNFFKSRD